MLIVLVLAALAATSAAASPDIPVTRHKHASAAAVHHIVLHHAVGRSVRRRSAHSAEWMAGYRAGHSRHTSRRAVVTEAAVARPAAVTVPPADAEASAPVAVEPASLHRSRTTPRLHRQDLARVVIPPPLKGSLESLTRQNERVEADGLERILDEDDLQSRIDQKLLVPLPASEALAVNPELIETHRYCRPWTADFLTDLARAHAARFHTPIEVSSAVRTVEYQQELMQRNGNAAAAEGDIVSPHLTGGTIDIAKHGMSRQELGWMRNWLLARQLAGDIDVEEEFHQACFHITVYRGYNSPPPEQAVKPRRRHPAAAAQVASGADAPAASGSDMPAKAATDSSVK